MAARRRKPRPPADRHADRVRREAEEVARLVATPVRHPHAAGIDVGDQAIHGVRLTDSG